MKNTLSSVNNVVQKTTLTLSISPEDKILLKTYAIQHQTTVSALLHDWVHQFCVNQNGDDTDV